MHTRLSHALGALTLAVWIGACHDEGSGGDAHVHGQDDAGLVFLDPRDIAHPNWLDFGEVELGDTRMQTVRLENVESKPIVVESIVSGCSCTVPRIKAIEADGKEVTGDARSKSRVIELAPHAVMEIELKVDSRLSPVINKDKLVIVRLTTDSEVDPYVTIEARMKIVSAFQAAPPEIDLRRIGANAGGAGLAEIASIGDSGRVLTTVLAAPEGVTATLEPGTRPGLMTWNLVVRAEPPLALGSKEHTLRVATSGPGGLGEGRPFEVKLRWTATADVEVLPQRLMFMRDSVDGKEHARGELFARMPGHRLEIMAHQFAGANADALSASVTAVRADESGKSDRWQIDVIPRDGSAHLPFDGLLVLTTSDPQFPRIEVPVNKRASAP